MHLIAVAWNIFSMPLSPILLPMKALYKNPDLQGFNAAKLTFLKKKLAANYFAPKQPVQSKWDCLINAFKAQLDTENRSLFTRFQKARKDAVENNQHVIQLEQLIVYFEHFYFFYCDTESDYKLTARQKENLLSNILAGMDPNICEPGIITRFDDALESFRADTNWIINHLHQHRRLIIQQIADEYNTKNSIDEGWSVHTVGYMFKLAQEQHFCLKQEADIQDIHLPSENKNAMRSYFNQVAPGKFEQYERDVVSNLTQHIMYEIGACLHLQGEQLYQWVQNTITLSQPQLVALGNLLEDKLHKTLEDFVVEDDEYNFQIIAKPDCAQVVQQLVEKKLIGDGYLTPLNEIKRSSYRDLFLLAGETIEMLLQFKGIMIKKDQYLRKIAIFAQNNPFFLVNYPNALTELILENPDLWTLLPKSLRSNSILIDACVAIIDNLLTKAIETEDDSIISIAKLVDCLWVITKSNPNYLKQLNPRLFADESIALNLVAKDGLLLKYVSDELWASSKVVETAQAKNANAVYYADGSQDLLYEFYTTQYRSLPESLAEFLPNPDISESNAPLIANLEKMQNILKLIQTRSISSGKLIRLAQCLHPTELLAIIKLRQDNQLPPLPHGDAVKLQQFNQAVNHSLWQDSGFLALKRELANSVKPANYWPFLSKDVEKDVARECLEQSNQWYLAFIAYQKKFPGYAAAFNTYADVLSQLKLSTNSLLKLVASMARLLLWDGGKILAACLSIIACGMGEMIFLAYSNIAFNFILANAGLMLPIIPLSLMLAYCCHKFLSPEMRALEITALLLFSPLLLPAFALIADVLLSFAWMALFGSVILFFKAAIHHLLEIPSLLSDAFLPWITRAFATFTHQKPVINFTDDEILKNDIENSILRLIESDEPSAVQKGELLTNLWEQIEVEHAAGTVNYSQALNKNYTVPVAGKMLDISFWEAANATRQDSYSFNPKAPDTRFSFFGLRGQSTTASQLRQHVDLSEEAAHTLRA